MGVLFAKPAPTRLGPALDMIRDQMQRAAGFVGTGEFDRLYRRYETGPGKNETPTVKALLRDLMQALERLKQEVHQ